MGQKRTNVITNLWSKNGHTCPVELKDGRISNQFSALEGPAYGLQLIAADFTTRSSLLTNLLTSVTSHIHPNAVDEGRRRFSK